jgi:hypothetical protein
MRRLTRLIEHACCVSGILEGFVKRIGLGNEFRVERVGDDITALFSRFQNKQHLTVADRVGSPCSHGYALIE